MSISRKSSFETIVEKGRDPLQFLSSPEQFREQLNLKGLSESAGKSFETLKRWQRASACFDHDLVQTIINKIVEQGDNSHFAIKKTLANAQQGQAFAESIVVFCDALAEKQNTENLGELLQNLITITEKAHRRSIKARDQLRGVCDTLSEISKDLNSQVSKIEDDAVTLAVKADPDDAIPSFNGVNTCFVAFPLKVPAVAESLSIQDNSDSDDEDAAPGGPGPNRAPSSKYKLLVPG